MLLAAGGFGEVKGKTQPEAQTKLLTVSTFTHRINVLGLELN